MEGIGKTHAEDAIADGGHAGIGGRGCDERDARELSDGRSLEGAGRSAFADERDDLVATDEFLGGRGGFPGEGTVVLDDEFSGPAEDAAPGVEIIDGEPRPAQRRFAKGSIAPRDRHEETDFYRLPRRRRRTGERNQDAATHDEKGAQKSGHGGGRFF